MSERVRKGRAGERPGSGRGIRAAIVTCLVLLAALSSVGAAAERERTSENDERLGRMLRQFPRADANDDGVLTRSEARDFLNERRERQRGERTAAPEPTQEDVRYGPHRRNVLDFWKAESDGPAPVVVYIHGGGFRGGDKRGVRRRGAGIVRRCLRNGVSFAAINYRFRQTTTLDNIMLDIARAIQFLRYRAEDWNIDKDRFAAYGGSAGGGASLWLAVHDDLADPDAEDPVLRESTRLSVAGHLNSQATYDCEKWADIVGVPDDWAEKMGMRDDLEFYGVKDRSQVNSPEARRIRSKVDMLRFMDEDDPPLYLHNTSSLTDPDGRGRVIHHPRHAIYLKKRCDELDIEAALVTRETPPEKRVDMLEFFFKHLGVTE